MTSQLPERPNLEQLKKRAKGLLHAAQAHDPEALARFQILPEFTGKAPEAIAGLSPALHDAQSVIAREHGFPSWASLREAVEERALSEAEAVEAFIRAALGGAGERARRLLGLHPSRVRAAPEACLVLGDAAAVEGLLAADPDFARKPLGPDHWEPLQFVCQSCLFRGDEPGVSGLVSTALVLLQHGANPNAEYHWDWHPELPRTVLWGAFCTVGHLPLAKALLEAGANPTDGVSLHILASGSHLAELDLLLAHGVRVDGVPRGVPPLCYTLGFAREAAGLLWLLEHGANPNLGWGDPEEAPLHVASRRWDVPMVEALVRHGAELDRPRGDGRTAYAIARLNANHEIAGWLLAHGASGTLSDIDRFASACASAEAAAVTSILQIHPGIARLLEPSHQLLLHRAAEKGDLPGLRTMLQSGFDPSFRDKDQVTPLHRAAMGGHREPVRLLLEHGASPNDLDGMFSASPLIWAVEGMRHPGGGADFPGVARLLLDAGTIAWKPKEETPQVEGTLERLSSLIRTARALPP